jgi:hypothetical protein
MKKMIILMLLIIAISSLNIYSQNLQNTSWKAYIAPGNLVGYLHFSKDTMSTSFDNVTYQKTSTYQEIDNNFSIVDLTEDDCPNFEIGKYTYKIQNDTLKFTLVNDLCTSRSQGLEMMFCVRVKTGVRNNISLNNVKIFPNPTSDYITIQIQQSDGYNVQIFNTLGIEIKNLIPVLYTNNEGERIDVSSLPAGVYYIKIGDNVAKFLKM